MLKQFFRYNLVGIANTFVGIGIIVLLMLAGFSPTLSNAIGYGVGTVLSYYLNSKYTFKSKKEPIKRAILFFIVLLFAYGLNYVTLTWTMYFLNPYLAQLLSAVVYTFSAFFMMRVFVFRG